MEPKLRIFLVDDHAIVREGLAALINMQPDMEVIGQASDGEMAITQLQGCPPDVLIVDISMPGINGVQLTARIREMCPDTLVLALTRHTESTYAHQILEAGAHGYLLKQAAAKDLIVAIHTVAEGGMYLDSGVAMHLINGELHQTSGAATEQELSEREAEVVRMIALGYSNKEIASKLNLSVKTIDTYKARAQEKLQLYTRTGLVRYAMERGWLSRDRA